MHIMILACVLGVSQAGVAMEPGNGTNFLIIQTKVTVETMVTPDTDMNEPVTAHPSKYPDSYIINDYGQMHAVDLAEESMERIEALENEGKVLHRNELPPLRDSPDADSSGADVPD